MKEIEILVRVNDSKRKALSLLSRFRGGGANRTVDLYFCSPINGKFLPGGGSYPLEWFRLRKKGKKAFITYKADKLTKAGKWLYSDEHEVEVSDFDTTKKIISSLGFKPLVAVDNEKHVFFSGDFEIVLEDVKSLGLFLEVEIVRPRKESVGHARKRISRFISSLRMDVSEELHIGKPELMLKKKHL